MQNPSPVSRYLAAALLLGVVVVCTMLAALAHPIRIDRAVMLWSAGHRLSWMTPVMVDVSDVFAPAPAIAIACLVAAVVGYMRRDVWASVTVLVPTAVTMICVVALKLAVERPRPPQWAQAVHEVDASFPSGHSAGALALAIAAVVALWPALHSTAARAVVVVLGTGLPALVAFARIDVDAHWLTDVLAGLALAGAIGLVLPTFLADRADRLEERIPLRTLTARIMGSRAAGVDPVGVEAKQERIVTM